MRTTIYGKVVKVSSDFRFVLNSFVEQRTLLLHAPNLLNSLLNIALAHSWLLPTVRIMHLHANLAQAIFPGADKMIQFPGVDDPAEDLSDSLEGLIERLEETGDQRLDAVKKAGEKWGKLEVVDASYKGTVLFACRPFYRPERMCQSSVNDSLHQGRSSSWSSSYAYVHRLGTQNQPIELSLMLIRKSEMPSPTMNMIRLS